LHENKFSAKEGKTIKLPSGKTALIEQGKGKDLLQAQMKAKTSDEIPYALIAELVEIDGQKLVYEDILELDLADVITLQGEISGKLQGVKPAAAETSEEDKEQEKLEVTAPLTETLKSLNSPTANQ